jgi:hypothetical protein
MQRKFFISVEKKEELFHTELIKCGVDYQKAAQVAQILALEKPDELLTEKEIELTKEVCQEWLTHHKRLTSIFRDY